MITEFGWAIFNLFKGALAWLSIIVVIRWQAEGGYYKELPILVCQVLRLVSHQLVSSVKLSGLCFLNVYNPNRSMTLNIIDLEVLNLSQTRVRREAKHSLSWFRTQTVTLYQCNAMRVTCYLVLPLLDVFFVRGLSPNSHFSFLYSISHATVSWYPHLSTEKNNRR